MHNYIKLLLSLSDACIFLYLHTVLTAFVQFVTGSPVVSSIVVMFNNSAEAEAISANTCGRQLTLSTLIRDKEVFVSAIAAVVPDTAFTMP